ncbi:unnamed protein product [Soboliphyme baturini]|uniref:Uncharacterized protein n=1 Tax=Soboliphyme baturini TaxID=241478 RepID=A0A183IZB8_9BILA|nr:unnamed protein product [Soboliphyme baturini]
MRVNASKTKLLVLSRSPDRYAVQMNGEAAEQVEKFLYLWVTFPGDAAECGGGLCREMEIEIKIEFEIEATISVAELVVVVCFVFVPLPSAGRSECLPEGVEIDMRWADTQAQLHFAQSLACRSMLSTTAATTFK